MHSPGMPGAQLLQPLQGLLAQVAADSLQKNQIAALAEHGHRERRDQLSRVGPTGPLARARLDLDRSERGNSDQSVVQLAQLDLLVGGVL